MMTRADGRAGGPLLVRDWLGLARLPFHTVGILPFILGTVLAAGSGAPLRIDLLAAGLAVVVCVMLATYLLGECFDLETDRLSASMDRNRFSGGSQVLLAGRIARWQPAYVAAGAVVVAAVAGAYVVVATGQLALIALGAFGIVAGVFYSVPPFRWAYRGIGEALIGVCYGWLPVVSAYLMQAGEFSWRASLVSLPAGLTVFNVILINEIPDEPADRRVGKRNLAVRLGRRGAAGLYAFVCLLAAAAFVGVLAAFSDGGTTSWAVAAGTCVFALALGGAMLAGRWKDHDALERLCGLSIVLNLAGTVALTVLCRV